MARQPSSRGLGRMNPLTPEQAACHLAGAAGDNTSSARRQAGVEVVGLSEPKDTDGRPRRVSIRDIARAAKVSTTAVSYALNGTGRLDERTRLRVIEIADQIGYRRNPNARNLRRERSGVLAIATSVPPGMASA